MDDLVIGKVKYRRTADFEVHYILGFSIYELSQRRFVFLYTLAGMGNKGFVVNAENLDYIVQIQ
ncbi:hypothetical protein SDJN02_20068, partial [Cucurbita argyrosperma subsp. argyrosperma]